MSIKVGKKEGASGEEGGYKVRRSQGASSKKTGKCVNDLFFFLYTRQFPELFISNPTSLICQTFSVKFASRRGSQHTLKLSHANSCN